MVFWPGGEARGSSGDPRAALGTAPRAAGWSWLSHISPRAVSPFPLLVCLLGDAPEPCPLPRYQFCLLGDAGHPAVWPCSVHPGVHHPRHTHPPLSPAWGCPRTAGSFGEHEARCLDLSRAPGSLGTCSRRGARCWKMPRSGLPEAATRSKSGLSTELRFPSAPLSQELAIQEQQQHLGRWKPSGGARLRSAPGALSAQPGCPCSSPRAQRQAWSRALPLTSPARANPACPRGPVPALSPGHLPLVTRKVTASPGVPVAPRRARAGAAWGRQSLAEPLGLRGQQVGPSSSVRLGWQPLMSPGTHPFKEQPQISSCPPLA